MPRSATFRLSRGTEPARFSRDTALSNEKDEKGGKKERAKGTEGRGGGGGGRRRYKEKKIRYCSAERKGFCL